jgi:hypothetical protein
MLRKSILTIAATATLATAALAFTPASASAHWGGGWGHHTYFHGPIFVPQVRVFSPPVYAGYDSCLRRRWVSTPYGMRLRWVNVCAY